MNPPVKIICPYCYSPDLSMYLEGLHGSQAGAMSMPSGNVETNNTELKCNACGHIFKPAQGKLSQEAAGTVTGGFSSNPAAGADDAYIRNIIHTQGKLSAVMYCKDTYGWGLQQAKDYVDRLTESSSNIPAPAYQTNSGPDPDAVAALVQSQGLLAAIKFVTLNTGWNLQQGKSYVDRLIKERNLQPKKACFVATACYGDEDAPEVVRFRKYRDEVLIHAPAGRAFIHIYYALSPALASWIARSTQRRDWVKRYLLTPLLQRMEK